MQRGSEAKWEAEEGASPTAMQQVEAGQKGPERVLQWEGGIEEPLTCLFI